MITYRMLPTEEWNKAKPLFKLLFPNTPFPGNQMSSMAVAEEDGEIVGFWFFQLCAHAEPVGIHPEKGNNVSLFKLRDVVHKAFSHCAGMEYYICTPDSYLGGILEHNGLRPIGVTFAGTIPKGIEDEAITNG